MTFAHVFAGSDTTEAQGLLETLRADDVAPGNASRHGTRFAYHHQYVDRGLDLIEGHFGSEFAEHLPSLPRQPGWQGPLRSKHGLHLVFLIQFKPAHTPALSEIEDRVRADLRRSMRRKGRDRALEAIKRRYVIEHDVRIPAAASE